MLFPAKNQSELDSKGEMRLRSVSRTSKVAEW